MTSRPKSDLIEIFNYNELDVIYSGNRVQDLRPVVQQNNSGFCSEGCRKHYTTILLEMLEEIEEVAVLIVVVVVWWQQRQR